MSKIRFHYPYKRLPFKQVSAVKLAVEDLFNQEGCDLVRLNYVFCTDDYLLDINKQFLNHDFFTDIVTFDLSEERSGIIGELYISLDRVKENSIFLKSAYQAELLRVIFHGALHLAGYKDKTKREITKMREKEDHYLHLFVQKQIK